MSDQQETFSPRAIIQKLDVEEIDLAIEDLKEELAALQQLRKVAAAKSGKDGKGGPKNSAAGGKSQMAERMDHAHQILTEFGSMSYRKLAERVGYDQSKAFWILKAAKKDDRFTIAEDGETIRLR